MFGWAIPIQLCAIGWLWGSSASCNITHFLHHPFYIGKFFMLAYLILLCSKIFHLIQLWTPMYVHYKQALLVCWMNLIFDFCHELTENSLNDCTAENVCYGLAIRLDLSPFWRLRSHTWPLISSWNWKWGPCLTKPFHRFIFDFTLHQLSSTLLIFR